MNDQEEMFKSWAFAAQIMIGVILMIAAVGFFASIITGR
jgi:hypothetical protein